MRRRRLHEVWERFQLMEIGGGEGFKMKFLARRRDFHSEENRDEERRGRGKGRGRGRDYC